MSRYEAIMKRFGFRYVKGEKKVPDEAAIAELERRLGAPLPADYKDFVREYGGTAFDASVKFPTRPPCDWGAEGTPDVFFGVLGKGSYDLGRNLDTYEDRIPRELLPIATDPGGNMVCLAVAGPKAGHVFFWDHEKEEAPGPDGRIGYGNTCLIATSFDGFMQSLFARP